MEPNVDEQETGRNIFPVGKFGAVISILILLGLYLSTFYNYLLFHTLVEMFSIVVACGIFMVAWNVRRVLDNNYLLFLGIAFLFIAFLDLIHTLAYKGMPIFQGYGADLPTQLWIAARYMESLSLLIAPLFLHRRLKPSIVFSAYTALSVLLLVSLFHWHIFPHCFVEGVGLTPFKKISEVVISMILLGALAVLFKNRKAFDPNVLRLLAASIVITIVSELAFTFYISVYGLSNLFGHFCKLISFYLIYKAIIETGLVRPYAFLFRNLKQSETSLRESEEKYRTVVEQSIVGIAIATGPPPRFVFANSFIADISGYTVSEITTMSPLKIYELIHPDDQEIFFRRFSDRLAGKNPPSRYEFRGITKDKRIVWMEMSSSLVQYQGKPAVLALFTDITGRKKLEDELHQAMESLAASNRRLIAISRTGLDLRETVDMKDAFRFVKEVIEEMEYGSGILARHQEGELYIQEAFLTPTQIQNAEKIIGKEILGLTVSSELMNSYKKEGAPLFIEDPAKLLSELLPLMSAKEIDGLVQLLDLHQLMVAPLTVRDKELGYLAVWSKKLQEEDLQTLGVISHQLAISIDNFELIDTIRSQAEDLKHLSVKLIQVQEQERKSLSRELHDEVGQALTAVAINLGTIKQDIPLDLRGKLRKGLQSRLKQQRTYWSRSAS